MEHMTLEMITACCNGIYFGEEAQKNTEVTGIAIDSRKVKKGGILKESAAPDCSILPSVFGY